MKNILSSYSPIFSSEHRCWFCSPKSSVADIYIHKYFIRYTLLYIDRGVNLGKYTPRAPSGTEIFEFGPSKPELWHFSFVPENANLPHFLPLLGKILVLRVLPAYRKKCGCLPLNPPAPQVITEKNLCFMTWVYHNMEIFYTPWITGYFTFEFWFWFHLVKDTNYIDIDNDFQLFQSTFGYKNMYSNIQDKLEKLKFI